MKISSIICTADILQTLSKITDSNLLQKCSYDFSIGNVQAIAKD